MKENSQKFILEWREKGRWILSVNLFESEFEAAQHAGMIGARKFRVRNQHFVEPPKTEKEKSSMKKVKKAREFKLNMQKGENVMRVQNFSNEPPKIILVRDAFSSYLWVGGEAGPCYATLSGKVRLRKLARAILAEVGE